MLRRFTGSLGGNRFQDQCIIGRAFYFLGAKPGA
ncbi:MAG: hypothetical protein RI962_1611 [Pseudomonadota bacterium]